MHSLAIGSGSELPVEVLEIIIRHVLRPVWTCMSDAIESSRNNQNRLHILLVSRLWRRIAQYVDPCLRIKTSDPCAMMATLPMGCKRVKLIVDTDLPPIDIDDGEEDEGRMQRFRHPIYPPPLPMGLMSHWKTLAEALERRERDQENASRTRLCNLQADKGKGHEQGQHRQHQQHQRDPLAGTIELYLMGKLVIDSQIPTRLAQAQLGHRITLLALHFTVYTELDVAYFLHCALVFPNSSPFFTSQEDATSTVNLLPNLEHLLLHRVTLRRLPWSWVLRKEAKELLTLSLEHVRSCANVMETLLRGVCGPRLLHLRLAHLWLTLGPARPPWFIPAAFASIRDSSFDRITQHDDSSLISVELPGIHELEQNDMYKRMRALFPRVRIVRLIHDEQLEIILTFSPRQTTPPPPVPPSSSTTASSSSSLTITAALCQLNQLVSSYDSESFDPSHRFDKEMLAEEMKSDEFVLTDLEIQGPLQPNSFPARVINKFLRTHHARHLCRITGLP
ncbi:hypothetical protein DFQ27_003039 [Actinomortierella ambigua]|uniref:Uncharacterized protein n=1 Tax=Actinomortierella ambigua TaxID=1343610 RepID=A0A9P6QIK3_9FUNG|nr:hypothetical protein DFQ27_003039 [Actinomortierella ambigua]